MGILLQERARKTREIILATSAALFARNGYALTTVAVICTSGHFSSGALHFHFPTKMNLANAVIEEGQQQLQAKSHYLLDSDLSGLRAMLLMTETYAHELATNPLVAAGVRFTLEASGFAGVLREPYDQWIAMCITYIDRAKTAGEISPETNPQTLARHIISCLTGIKLVSDIIDPETNYAEQFHTMWTLILPTITTPKGQENIF